MTLLRYTNTCIIIVIIFQYVPVFFKLPRLFQCISVVHSGYASTCIVIIMILQIKITVKKLQGWVWEGVIDPPEDNEI